MFWPILFLCIVASRAYDYDWSRLHACLTADNLKETVDDYLQHFPCVDCREHFAELMQIHPFPIEFVRTTEDTRVWTWFTHNLVNIRLNKTWESFDIMLECAQSETSQEKETIKNI